MNFSFSPHLPFSPPLWHSTMILETRRTRLSTRDHVSAVDQRQLTMVISSSNVAPAPPRTPNAARLSVQRECLFKLPTAPHVSSVVSKRKRAVSNGCPRPPQTITVQKSIQIHSHVLKLIPFTNKSNNQKFFINYMSEQHAISLNLLYSQ